MTQQTKPDPTPPQTPDPAPTPPRISLVERLRENGVDPLKARNQTETIRILQSTFGPSKRRRGSRMIPRPARSAPRQDNQALADYRNKQAVARREAARVLRANAKPKDGGRTVFQERILAILHAYRTRSPYRSSSAVYWLAARMGLRYETVYRWKQGRNQPTLKSVALLAVVEHEVANGIFAIPTLPMF